MDISKTERRRKKTKTGRKRANIKLFKSVGGMEMKQREVEKNEDKLKEHSHCTSLQSPHTDPGYSDPGYSFKPLQ